MSTRSWTSELVRKTMCVDNASYSRKLIYIYKKIIPPMSLLNQNKGKKKNDKKKNQNSNTQGSKFIQKPQNTSFVSKQANTGSQRGS